MAGGGGLDVRAQAVEGVAIGVKLCRPLLGHVGQRTTFFAGPTDRFVVDVGEVAHVFDVVGAEFEFEQAADDVVHDEGAEVADVGRGVDGRAAIIEPENAVGVRRSEFAERAREGFVELKGHAQEEEKRRMHTNKHE